MGRRCHYIVLDDASDTTKAVTNTRKLITEDKVRRPSLGSTIVPSSLAMIDVVGRGSGADDLDGRLGQDRPTPWDANRRWVFKTPQNDVMMSIAIAAHMKGPRRQARRLHRLSRTHTAKAGTASFSKAAALKGITIVGNERFARAAIRR